MGEEDIYTFTEEYTEENLIKFEKLMKTRYGK